jgi:hypothetical protein
MAMKLKLFIITLLAIMVAGCTLDEPIPEPKKEMGKMVTITATISPETRVAYNDDTRKLAWETGDTLLLAGYDGTTYKGSNKFHWTTGDSFDGIEVPGATTYKAYYPGEKVTLDDNGNVQLADTFWQQTQTGNGTTAHLSKKPLLNDEEANPINQAFNLVLKSSILKLVLSGIPQEVGTLQQLIYTVETAPGVLKSLPLNVTGVPFSAALDNITAFLAFDPAVVTNIPANGKVNITLFGEQTYEWSATSITGKNYTAGNRYTGTVTGVWTEKELINPLRYVAEYNVNPAGTGFVTNLTACNVSGYFTWSDAVARFHTRNDIPGYHLPSNKELSGIVPQYVDFFQYPIIFTSQNSRNNVTENVTVNSENITMTSDIYNTGNYVSYLLRYKGTDMVSAWRYELKNYDTNDCHIKITSRNVAPSVTIDDIIANNGAFWNTGTANDVVRYLPASGNNGNNAGRGGHFWSSTEAETDKVWIIIFGKSAIYTTYFVNITGRFTVRLFENP